MFLCRLAGDASASSADLPLKLHQRGLLAVDENCLPWHAVERNRFRDSDKSACNDEIVLISRDLDDHGVTRRAFDRLHAVHHYLRLLDCMTGIGARDIDFKRDEIEAIEHLR